MSQVDNENESVCNKNKNYALMFTSPQVLKDNHNDIIPKQQTRNDFPKEGDYAGKIFGMNRFYKSPIPRTPQNYKHDLRKVEVSPTFSDLPDATSVMMFPDNRGTHNYFISHTSSHDHHRDFTPNHLMIPREMRHGSIPPSTLRGKCVLNGPINATTKNVMMQDKISSPVQEKKVETICYKLKKINNFKTRNLEVIKKPSNAKVETIEQEVVDVETRKFKRIKKSTRLKKFKYKPVLAKVSKICCGCKKSNCKKSYCNCFKFNVPCNSKCGCSGCDNNETFKSKPVIDSFTSLQNNEKTIQHGVKSNYVEELKAIQGRDSIPQTSIGCNCRKSFCQKKYCDCFSKNVKCTAACRCFSCCNN